MERRSRGFRLSVGGETVAQGLRLPFLAVNANHSSFVNRKPAVRGATPVIGLPRAFIQVFFFFFQNLSNIRRCCC